jgi:dienelactone hydrolase
MVTRRLSLLRLGAWRARTLRVVLVLFAALVAIGDLPAAEPTGSASDQPAPAPFAPTPEQLAEGYRRSVRPPLPGTVYKSQIVPHWFEGDAYFWYVNQLADSRREYVLVDARQGHRRLAFDHQRLAAALEKLGGQAVDAERLALAALRFLPAEQAVEFDWSRRPYRCDLQSYQLTPAGALAADSPRDAAIEDIRPISSETGAETELTVANQTAGPVELFWLDAQGRRRSYGKIDPGQEHRQHTYEGHVWEAVDQRGELVLRVRAHAAGRHVEITPASADGRQSPRRQRSRDEDRPRPHDENCSPAAGPQPSAFVRDHNVWWREAEQGDEIPLSEDGTADRPYVSPQVSPDGHSVVAFRVEPGDDHRVHRIESSPSGGGRARLHSNAYPLPGDKLTTHQLHLFLPAERRRLHPEIEPFDFGRPNVRWRKDGRRLLVEKADRGHQRFQLLEVDSHTGTVRPIIDERSETFVWTAHRHDIPPILTWLSQTEEVIYASERDGWRHFYLVNLDTAAACPITAGPWVVRGIDRVDEERRELWFRACGRNPDQDPYLMHYYRVNFDGSGLVALTESDGHHRIQLSPGGEFLIATHSRIDRPPVHELRRTSDGALVCLLEQADASQLEHGGWRSPEVFVAKGRDGQTDIWGIICRPRDFDPARKYPVIEHIYAGPHGAFVPKSFSTRLMYHGLTELGFVVVQIDGMGTAHRSKVFHDVCWHNLKDAGFPDRILWHRAAAERYSWYDAQRVGIYGVSAGGQNAAAAVLFHPEFYKAAVAACGCHDNRMDKASWNEQWMGYPVGPHYAECSNIDHAHRLAGELLLIVGEMDSNVPPESTLRLADALVRSGKDFDLMVVPGGGHGLGGAYGERRMKDFFVRHLHRVEPPRRNDSQPPSAESSGQAAASSDPQSGVAATADAIDASTADVIDAPAADVIDAPADARGDAPAELNCPTCLGAGTHRQDGRDLENQPQALLE